MTTHSSQHFGGRADSEGLYVPAEADLQQWALERGFAPVQAQALLCKGSIYANSYRPRLLIPHEFEPGAVQEYNKTVAKGSKVNPVKVLLNPMHLKVHEAYCKAKVRLARASLARPVKLLHLHIVCLNAAGSDAEAAL